MVKSLSHHEDIWRESSTYSSALDGGVGLASAALAAGKMPPLLVE
jgi:hypothetical protein